jgi:hypothetical protein
VKIPKGPVERQQFYDELTRQCLASRQERFAFYNSLRNYYLFGAASKEGAPYNKIGSTIDTLSSFIYSPDAVRFSIHLGETADPEDVYKAVPIAREVTDQWRMSGTHLRFGLALKWSFVFGSMLMKVQWSRANKMIRTYLVEPHQFGVLREDVIELTDQEAYCMCYTITRTQLESMLEGNPRKGGIMARAGSRGSTDGTKPFSEGLNRLIIGGPVDGIAGSIATGQGTGSSSYIEGGMTGRGSVQYSYGPKVEADLIDMCDLYVYDDDLRDYQLASIAAPGVTIYDRPASRVGIAGAPHFVVVRPEHNLYDYFWGDSFTARLAWLQDWRTERVYQIRELLAKQLKPPKYGVGMGGIAEEKFAALNSPGGFLSAAMPGGKIESLAPQMPADVFAEVAQIDQMFDDIAGIGHVLQGKGEPGVRSRGQADLMARLGSSRPKERAIVAEEAAEDIASLMLRNVQEESPQRFKADAMGKELIFTAEQFTKDFEVKVDAHSSSPIFVEDRKHDAIQLFEAHAIDRETLLDMYDPPGVQMLKERLKKIEAQEQKQAQMAAAAGQDPHTASHHGKGK